MSRSEYPASESLAREWVDCWNLRDIDRLISLYHPDIVRLSALKNPFLFYSKDPMTR